MSEDRFDSIALYNHLALSTNLFVQANGGDVGLDRLTKFIDGMENRLRVMSKSYQDMLKDAKADSEDALTAHANVCRTTLNYCVELRQNVEAMRSRRENPTLMCEATRQMGWVRAHLEVMENGLFVPTNASPSP